MTDTTMSLSPPARPWDRVARLAPPGGWLSLALVVLMCVTLGAAIDDARVILGHGEWTDLLVWAAIGGALVGSLGPTIGWGRWTTYAIGAAIASLVVPLMAGASLPDAVPAEPAAFGTWMAATADEVASAIDDLLIQGSRSTNAIGHHMLVLGLWVWASSMFAGYAVFGHRRPLNAVLLIGVLLVVSMSLSFNDQLVYLILYSLAALFLLIRSHSFEEQADWLRRRIGDPSTIASLYLRGGTIFIVLTVAGALLLTNVARSQPLASVWTDLGAEVIDWSRGFSAWLPRSGTGPQLAPEFGPNSVVQGSWVTSDEPVFTVPLQPADVAYQPLWRAWAYDLMTREGFDTSDLTTVDVAADTSLFEGAIDQATETGTRPYTFTIVPVQPMSDVLSPATPRTASIVVRESRVGETDFFAALERDRSRDPYTIEALVPVEGDDAPGQLTKNRLRAAATEYPTEIEARFAQPIDRSVGLLGPGFDRVHAEIQQLAAGANPYDYATSVVGFLKDPANFTYDPDLTNNDTRCGDLSYVECFADLQAGFCQHYAGMMVALMREVGVAARPVQGYRSGARDPIRLTETVRNSDSHAWVEVYFPGYGWVTFDPTGGSIGSDVNVELIEGVEQSGSPGASASAIARPSESERVDNEPPLVPPTTPTANIAGPLIVTAILLAATVGLLAFMAWRRGPRGPVTADGAYGMVTKMAARFGFGPRPNQTVYEYAGALSDILPDARPHLETVASAKVEVAYGGRRLGVDRMLSLRDAQRRLRPILLRLAFRRGRRGRRVP